jgi:hypothetical protein
MNNISDVDNLDVVDNTNVAIISEFFRAVAYFRIVPEL